MSTVMEFGIIGGLLLAAIVKTLLRFGWRRLTAPKGRHRLTDGPDRQSLRIPAWAGITVSVVRVTLGETRSGEGSSWCRRTSLHTVGNLGGPGR
jgi:hypothetical protein